MRTVGLVIILTTWLICLVWLGWTKIAPPLTVGEPPERRAVSVNRPEVSAWTVHWDDRSVGTFVEFRDPVGLDETGRPLTWTRARLTLTELPLGTILAQIGGPLAAMTLGPDRNVGWSFDVRTVTLTAGPQFVATAGGVLPAESPPIAYWRIHPVADRHRLDVFAGEALLTGLGNVQDQIDAVVPPSPESPSDTQTETGSPHHQLGSAPRVSTTLTAPDRRLYGRSLVIPSETLVQDLIASPVELGPLRVGQSWTVPVESPLGGGQTSILTATVEEELVIPIEGHLHPALKVVYHRGQSSRRRRPEAEVLVDPNGRVLEQTLILGQGRLTFRRAPEERVRPLARAARDEALWSFVDDLIVAPTVATSDPSDV